MTKEENTYSEKIDCSLNYHNNSEMVSLFEEAKSISPKSAYRFLEELINLPSEINKSKRLKKNIITILNHFNANFHHPLKKIALIAAAAKLSENSLPIRKSLIMMNVVRRHPQYYALLNIIVFSTRRNRNIKMVENLYNSIVTEW